MVKQKRFCFVCSNSMESEGRYFADMTKCSVVHAEYYNGNPKSYFCYCKNADVYYKVMIK